MKKIVSPLAFILSSLAAFAAYAQSGYVGMAKPWQMGFQEPVTPVMERLYDLHSFLLVIITLISVFVLAVMVYICIRFRRKANPVPSTTTHNTRLEVIWTAVPIVILVCIAIPSLRLHYYIQRVVDPDMTIKVVGYQWYWHYDYPDNGGFGFDSYILKGNDLKPGDIRQLSVDHPLVVPVDTKIRVLVTGADVIHSWSVPAFGVKRDAVPGRLNETWFEATKIGTFYGQCSQLCGVGHGFMPIVVDVVSKDDFNSWVKQKQPAAASPPASSEQAKPAAEQALPAGETAKPAGEEAKPSAPAKASPAASAKAPGSKPHARPQGAAAKSAGKSEGKSAEKSEDEDKTDDAKDTDKDSTTDQ